jgi:hypothetical protein
MNVIFGLSFSSSSSGRNVHMEFLDTVSSVDVDVVGDGVDRVILKRHKAVGIVLNEFVSLRLFNKKPTG